MKLTRQEIQLFESLQGSGTAAILGEFIGRLTDQLCDIRNMEGTTEAERKGRLEAARILEEELMNRLKV